MSNESVVLWNIAFPLSEEERARVLSAALFNLIINLRLDKKKELVQAPSSAWYQGLRDMMEESLQGFSTQIHEARMHLFEQRFSYPLQPFFFLQHHLSRFLLFFLCVCFALLWVLQRSVFLGNQGRHQHVQSFGQGHNKSKTATGDV